MPYPKFMCFSKDQSEHLVDAMTVLPYWNQKQTWTCKSYSWSFPSYSENLEYHHEQPETGNRREKGSAFSLVKSVVFRWRFFFSTYVPPCPLPFLPPTSPAKGELLMNLSVLRFLGYLMSVYISRLNLLQFLKWIMSTECKKNSSKIQSWLVLFCCCFVLFSSPPSIFYIKYEVNFKEHNIVPSEKSCIVYFLLSCYNSYSAL